MGTCLTRMQRIRKNGNHVKLGSVLHHKTCPGRPIARSAKTA